MRADLHFYLAQNCLMKTDRASMAFGLEARVPMLGNAVVDLVVPQPAQLKLLEGKKTVLMALAQRSIHSGSMRSWPTRRHRIFCHPRICPR